MFCLISSVDSLLKDPFMRRSSWPFGPRALSQGWNSHGASQPSHMSLAKQGKAPEPLENRPHEDSKNSLNQGNISSVTKAMCETVNFLSWLDMLKTFLSASLNMCVCLYTCASKIHTCVRFRCMHTRGKLFPRDLSETHHLSHRRPVVHSSRLRSLLPCRVTN